MNAIQEARISGTMQNHLQLALVVVCFLGSGRTVDGSDSNAALIIIDVQVCFLPGGSLAVTNGDKIIPVINSIRENNAFKVVAFSIDYHPPGHISFASAHNKSYGDSVNLQYSPTGELFLGDTVTKANFPDAIAPYGKPKVITQKLWPNHCVQNVSYGPTSYKLGPGLKVLEKDDLFIYKGTHKQIDSYSAFYDNGGFSNTSLDRDLKARNIKKVFIVGFALDVCVFFTSLDARKLEYDTYTVVDASLGIQDNSTELAKKTMAEKGVKLIKHTQIPEALASQSSFCGSCMAVIFICIVSRVMVAL